MSQGRLSALQVDVLRALAGMQPKWRLVGGGALAGFYTKHRNTRDLDLFWSAPEVRDLALASMDCDERLKAAGLGVEAIRTYPTFVQKRVSKGSEAVVVDLVIDSPPVAAPVRRQRIAEVEVDVEAPEEILVSKLCAILSRSELRDLVDVKALLAAGLALEPAVAAAPAKDGGFSPLVEAWVLEQFPVEKLARSEGMSDEEAAALVAFRDELVDRLLRVAGPA